MALSNLSGHESKELSSLLGKIIQIINSSEIKKFYETGEINHLIDNVRQIYFPFEREFQNFLDGKEYEREIDLRELLRKIYNKLPASIDITIMKKDKYTEILNNYIEKIVEFFSYLYNKTTLIDLAKVEKLNPPIAFHYYHKELKENFKTGNYLTCTILLGVITELLIIDFINVLIPNWDQNPNKLSTDFAEDKSISEKMRNLLKCVQQNRNKKYKKIEADAKKKDLSREQLLKLQLLKNYTDFESVMNTAHMSRMKRNNWVHPDNFSADNIPDKESLIKDVNLLTTAWTDILNTKEILEILYQ
ncbi:MAG: hypothetical protein GF308_18030 [Candidatus Heimdallarchaeota archaeon]|nr:hypothetical protein [Candidatus Heimdallarchaeota archaeon]